MLSRFHLIPERYGQTDGQNCYIASVKTRAWISMRFCVSTGVGIDIDELIKF